MNRYRMYVNGEFVESQSGAYFPVLDPSTEEIIAEVPDANEADVNRAAGEIALVNPSRTRRKQKHILSARSRVSASKILGTARSDEHGAALARPGEAG